MTVHSEISLNHEQIKLLQTLLKKRFRIFLFGILGTGYCLFKANLLYYWKMWYEIHVLKNFAFASKEFLEKVNWYVYSSTLFIAGLAFYFLQILFKQVLPLYKDTKKQIGMIIPMQIVRKSIPYHNRCFFYFDDLKIPYKEVNQDTYYSCKTGEFYPVLISKFSKTHIDEYLNIPLL